MQGDRYRSGELEVLIAYNCTLTRWPRDVIMMMIVITMMDIATIPTVGVQPNLQLARSLI